MNRTRLLPALAGLLLAGLLVAACAEPDGDGGGPAQGGATTVPSTSLTARPVQPAGQVTVTGMVTDGVEANCLLLEADGGTRYLLVGGDRAALRAGARLRVTGRVDRGLLSTCQQGEPLVVASVQPAP